MALRMPHLAVRAAPIFRVSSQSMGSSSLIEEIEHIPGSAPYSPAASAVQTTSLSNGVQVRPFLRHGALRNTPRVSVDSEQAIYFPG